MSIAYEYQKRHRLELKARGLRWARGNVTAQQARYRKRVGDRVKIYKQVFFAVKNGLLTKPNTCELCKEIKLIIAHHEDYKKPLEVTWVCHLCHYKMHLIRR